MSLKSTVPVSRKRFSASASHVKIWMKFLFIVLIYNRRRTRARVILCVYVSEGQCDQIWRNSTTLANISKYLAIYLRFIWFWAKFSTHIGIICMLLSKFHCWKWPNIENTIWSSGHTEVDSKKSFTTSSRSSLQLIQSTQQKSFEKYAQSFSNHL